MIDEKEINLLAFEQQVYNKWEREQKNHILSIRNGEKRQAKWNELFPQMEHSDTYLTSNIF